MVQFCLRIYLLAKSLAFDPPAVVNFVALGDLLFGVVVLPLWTVGLTSVALIGLAVFIMAAQDCGCCDNDVDETAEVSLWPVVAQEVAVVDSFHY